MPIGLEFFNGNENFKNNRNIETGNIFCDNIDGNESFFFFLSTSRSNKQTIKC